MITLTVYKHRRRRRRYANAKGKILKLLIIPTIIILSFLLYKIKFFTIIDGETKFKIITFSNTYLDELSKKKISIGNQDKTSIDAKSKIKNGSTFIINRNYNVKIIYEGKELNVSTNANNLLDMLKENNLPIKNTQTFSIDLKSKPKDEMTLVIDNIETKQVSKNESTIASSNSNTSAQTKHVVYEQTYKNGILIDEKIINEKIIPTERKYAIVTPTQDPNSIHVLVNKDYKLSSTFIPKNLVIPDVNFATTCSSGENQLSQIAATALQDMFTAAKNDNYDLYMVSGYRSYDTQKTIYSPGDSYTNQPGASEHQTGLAVDVVNSEVNNGLSTNNLAFFADSFNISKEGQWLLNNSWKFGFILRYPKEKVDITGISFESWHFRYVGKDLAKELYDLNETLEEYSNLYNTSNNNSYTLK